jgi:TolB protein
VLVLPGGGTDADSVRAILQRDLDYDDRATVVSVDDRSARSLVTARADSFDYPLVTKLGAAGIIVAENVPGGLSVRMYDVATQKLVQSGTFALPSSGASATWRLAIHGVSDEIGLWIFGSRGAARARILFTGADGQIWSIDSDGANARRLTSIQLAMSASWNPDGGSFAFSGASNGAWRIGVYDFGSGRISWRTPAKAGTIAISPAFSPDGQSIAFSYGDEQGTNLWLTDVGGGAPRRLNASRGTDNASPSYSPDGRRIAFTSGRAGHPEVYVMDADGSNAELLTEFNFGEQNYRGSPDWSPDGRNVAYQSQLNGEFEIMTIAVRDHGTKQFTREGDNEDPSWAPDSRHIVFSSTRSGAKQLWVVDTESGRLRQLSSAAGARLPAWSHTLTH